MKILYLVHQFYPEYQSGTEKFVFNMAYMSQKSGNKVKVVTYSLAKPDSFQYQLNDVLCKEFHYQGLPVMAFRYKQEPDNFYYQIDPDVKLNFALEILKQEKPDLIHAGHLMRVYPFIIAARQLNVPYLLTITDFFLLCPKIILAPTPDTLCTGPEHGVNCTKYCSELPDSFIVNRLETAMEIIRGASVVVAPSKFVARIFEQEVESLKVQINHHGIRQSNIESHNLVYQTKDTIRFGYIGTLVVHKGVHILISAFADLNLPNASLSIFGSGEQAYTTKLQELVGNVKVNFMGAFPAEDLKKVFGQIDVLIAPSICYETYSFVVHEALASEIPVIISNLGGMAEQIQHGFNGFTFRAGDQEDLQIQMRKFLKDPTILNNMKENIKLVNFVPNIEQEAYTYNRLYQSVHQNNVTLTGELLSE